MVLHHSAATPPVIASGERLAVWQHLTAVWVLQAGHDQQQRRLPRPRGPGDHQCLPGSDHGDRSEVAPPVAGISTVLQALADPIRLELLRALASSNQPVACGSFQVPVTKSTLSHQFRVLREAGAIEQRWDGTRKLTSLRRHDLDACYPG